MKFGKDKHLEKNPNFVIKHKVKHQDGKNASHICFLIKNNSIEDFISHVNCYHISL